MSLERGVVSLSPAWSTRPRFRVEAAELCGLPIRDDIGFTPLDTGVTETMTCGAGQTLTLDQTDFLLQNKDPNGYAVTTYFVSRYDASASSVGCNDVLGYTTVTFRGSGQPILVSRKGAAVRLRHEPDDGPDRPEGLGPESGDRARRGDLPPRARPPVRPAARRGCTGLPRRDHAQHQQGDGTPVEASGGRSPASSGA